MKHMIKNMTRKQAIDFINNLKRKCSLEVVEAKILLNDKDLTGIILDEEILLELIKGEKVRLVEDYYFVLESYELL